MHKCQAEPGEQQEWYSVDAAAAYLTIGTTTVYKAIQQRQLKHARFGKSIRISHEHLCRWVQEQTRPTLAELKARGSTKFKRGQPTPYKRGRIGRPRIWPPKEIDDYRRLAKRIEKKILKEDRKAK